VSKYAFSTHFSLPCFARPERPVSTPIFGAKFTPFTPFSMSNSVADDSAWSTRSSPTPLTLGGCVRRLLALEADWSACFCCSRPC
jgi:hypothetical protein